MSRNPKKKKKTTKPQNTEEILVATEELAEEFNDTEVLDPVVEEVAAPIEYAVIDTSADKEAAMDSLHEPMEQAQSAEGLTIEEIKKAFPEPEPFYKRHKTLLVGVGCAIAGIALAAGIAVGFNGIQNQDRITAMEASQEVVAAQAAEHVHTWIPQTETHHIEAKTETIFHPAVYEDVVIYHTVCNVCGTNIDGIAEEHKADTGHSYTTNVPKTEKHLKTAEWTETVVVEDARDEVVNTGVLCTSCGETLNMDQANAQGITVPDAQQ